VPADVRTGQVLRAANRFGLVAATGELAIELAILPWASGSVMQAAEEIFASWYHERGGNDPAEVRNAITQVRSIIERFGDSRFDKVQGETGERPVLDRLGFVRGSGEQREWLIQPETWRSIFCKGFNPKMVARVLADREMLLPDPEGKFSRSERV